MAQDVEPLAQAIEVGGDDDGLGHYGPKYPDPKVAGTSSIIFGK